MAKKKAKRNSALDKARDVGFQGGWNDGDDVPNTFGAAAKAKKSYGEGLKARKKAIKIDEKIDKLEQQKSKLKKG